MGVGLKSPFAPSTSQAAPAGAANPPLAPVGQEPQPVPAPLPPPPPTGSVVRKVPRERIRPSALQPRRDFPAESLQELADSIREQGIIQPLVVRPVGDHFELIAGERRWRAAGLVGLAEVPVIERLATDLEVLELALIENLQRENLNPIEEALGYQQLMTQFSLTQEQVGIKVGRSRAVIANATRLLKLPASIQASVRDGSLSVGHAKVILGADDPERQETLARLSLRGGWTVRQLEAAVSAQGSLGKGAKADPRPKVVEPPVDPHLADLENRIRERVGLRVVLHYRAGLGGRFEVQLHNDGELDRLLEVLGVGVD